MQAAGVLRNYSRKQGFQESRKVLAKEAGISSVQLGQHGSAELTEMIPCDGGCMDMDMDFREISWGAEIQVTMIGTGIPGYQLQEEGGLRKLL